MFNVGGGEILVILLLALIVLGPEKLPNAARQAGKYLSEFRRMSSGFQQELRDAMDLTSTPDPGPSLPPLDTKASPEATSASPATPPKIEKSGPFEVDGPPGSFS